MKEISVKQISIILLSLIFLLIISIVIGGRLQIYFLQKYNGDLMLAQEVKNKLLELNLALEESLMPVYNYLITGTVDYEEQKQLEKNVQDKFNSLLNIISTDSHKEYIEILSPYHDSMSVFINKIIDYENLIVNDMVGTQERINIMEATNESVENYMLIYNKYTNNIDNIINKIKYPMNVKLRIAVIIVLIFASILVFTIFFIFIKFITHMNKFLYNYEHFLETVTKEKNFKARIDSLPITEIKHIILLLNNFLKEIHETFIVFNQHSNELAAFSEELSASSEEISSATEEVASSTELITEEISSVKDNTDDIKGNVNDLQELMNQTEGYLNKSKSINEEFMKLMSNETNLIDDSSNKFDEMEESLKNVQLFIDDFSNQINTIQESVDSIKNIHKKIELLSLNAAIEAARAGKEGGGFAVIAEEIRSLSSRSAEASGEIEKVMGDVISNIKQLHQLINQSMDGFINIQKEWSVISDISTKIQGESTVSYEESMKINKHISDLKNRFTFVNDSFIEIIKKIETIVSTSEEISSSNEEISSQMEELAASSEQLSSKARTIKEFIDQYKL